MSYIAMWHRRNPQPSVPEGINEHTNLFEVMLFDYFIQLLYTVFSYKQCCGYPIFKVFLEPPATHCTGDRYVLGEYISDYYKSSADYSIFSSALFQAPDRILHDRLPLHLRNVSSQLLKATHSQIQDGSCCLQELLENRHRIPVF